MKKLILCLMTVGLMTACSDQDERPSTETTVTINTDDTKDSINDAMKKTGDAIERGAEKTKDALNNAGEAIKDEYQDAKDALSDDDKKSIEVEVKKD